MQLDAFRPLEVSQIPDLGRQNFQNDKISHIMMFAGM